MLDNLAGKFSSAVKTLTGNAVIRESNIEDALHQVRIALLEADVAINVVKQFIDEVKQEALGQKVLASLTPDQTFIDIVRDKLTVLMGEKNQQLNLNAIPPAVILLAGLQGAGKTTTAAKLAKLLSTNEKKKVLVVSIDTYRPAAMEQLQTLAQSINVPCFNSFMSKTANTPLVIAETAHHYAQKNYFDVLIIDSAGRLAIDTTMMEEIKSVHQMVKPIETLFIADAMLGQDAVNTVKRFDETLALTGIILTKMDGDARGGAALSMRQVTGKPIKFIGVSEKITESGLEPFYPDRLASRILGMGDVLSLIDKVKSSVNVSETKKLADKVKKGKKFDLEDFRNQFAQVTNMSGGLGSILDKLPIALQEKSKHLVNDKSIKRNLAIIDSMTIQERRKPEILKASRKRRIATGSGTSVQEINQLLKQFEQTNEMMKKFAGGGGMLKMMNQFKHLLPGGF